jgi:hypothetical protein
MFTIDADIKDLKVKERDMTKAFFSMNNHQVATPEMMSEEARSYVVFFSEAGGKISAFIGIHLLLTGRKLFYAHSSNPFPERDLGSVEEEARTFAEGLGAMLDEVSLSTMSREEKERWIDKQDIFSPDREKSVITEAPEPSGSAASEAEVFPVPEKPLQSQPAPPAQDVPQPSPPQPEPADSIISQSPQPQQVQTDTIPPEPIVSPVSREQPVMHILPEPIAPEPPTGPAPSREANSKRQRTEKPPVQSEEGDSREPEQTYTNKTAQARTASKGQRELIQEAINAGIMKTQKPKVKKAVQPSTGVVSRDREALARLLASF